MFEFQILDKQEKIRQNFLKKSRGSKQNASGRNISGSTDGNELTSFLADIARLKKIQSFEDRLPLKKEYFEKYSSYFGADVTPGDNRVNQVISHLAVWGLDIGNLFGAFKFIRVVLNENLGLPPSFSAPPADYLVREFAKLANKEIKEGLCPNPMLEELVENLDSGKWPVVDDKIKAGAFKVLGEHYDAQNDEEKALDIWVKAYQIHSDVGVKTRLKLAKRLPEG